MRRKLSTVRILSDVFLVDAYKEELRERENSSNRIPFQVFEPEKDGYRFLYDTLRKNIPEQGTGLLEDPERYIWASIPALMELDPEGIALRYEIPLEILCPEGMPPHREITAVLHPIDATSKRNKIKFA